MILILLCLLVIGALFFIAVFLKDYLNTYRKGKLETEGNIWALGLTGFLICFFDTLGIGGFAPLTAIFKHFHWVKDRVLPGTLNTAMCIPAICEALIFIKEVPVDVFTLVSMLMAAVAGGQIGASIVAKLDERKIQVSMALSLGAFFLLMLAGKFGMLPSGGEALGLTGTKLVIAILGNFLFGALMTLGIGLFAPCMALVYALGMNPIAAFPIMMASCAFLMPVASIKFIKAGSYNRRCTLIITLTGIFGVIIAANLVKSLPLDILTWLIMGIIAYTAIRLFIPK